jgi:tRNA-binding protein
MISWGAGSSDHERQILVGMKEERDNPKEIVGLQVLFVVNLEPRKIKGNCPRG